MTTTKKKPSVWVVKLKSKRDGLFAPYSACATRQQANNEVEQIRQSFDWAIRAVRYTREK